jgi:D-3-phosphoglycerate dehydrogenase
VDKPGQLGKIGTILGSHGINISTMEVGVRAEGGPSEVAETVMALILMNVDEPVPPQVRAEIKEAVGVVDGWFLQL